MLQYSKGARWYRDPLGALGPLLGVVGGHGEASLTLPSSDPSYLNEYPK